MSTENCCEIENYHAPILRITFCPPEANGKLAEEAGTTNRKELFTVETHLQPTLKAWRCWGIIERQTNQQQKAKLKNKCTVL